MSPSQTPDCIRSAKTAVVDIYGIKSRRRVSLFKDACAAANFMPMVLFDVGKKYMVAMDSKQRMLYMRQLSISSKKLEWTFIPEMFSRRLRLMSRDRILMAASIPGSLTLKINLDAI